MQESQQTLPARTEPEAAQPPGDSTPARPPTPYPRTSRPRLPIDPVPLALGIWKRKYIILLGITIAVAAAFWSADRFGSSVYEASTVLLYKPRPVEEGMEFLASAPLPTQMNLVKILPNLEMIREKLGLRVSPGAIDKALTVTVERRTELLTVSTRWGSATGASDLANAAREVFLESQRQMRLRQLQAQIKGLEARLEKIHAQLTEAEGRLGDFAKSEHVVDLNQEAKGYIEHYNSVDLLLDQARIEKKTVDLQAGNMDRIIKELQTKAAEERKAAAQVEAISDVNLRVQRLRESIMDDRDVRGNNALLAKKEAELKAAEGLLAEGLISELQYEQLRLDYEKQKVVTVDTDEIKVWKKQMKDLDAIIVPESGDTQSDRLAQEMVVRSFNIQLEKVSITEKVKYLEEARARAARRLESLPELQRKYATFNRPVLALESEKKDLESVLHKARRIYESDLGDFLLVSEAKPAANPVKSNRKVLALGLAGAGSIFCILGILVLEVLDLRIKTRSQLKIWTRLLVLPGIPRLPAGTASAPGDGTIPAAEQYKLVAKELARDLPEGPRRLLVLGPRGGEGVTSFLLCLAAMLGRRGSRVLAVDLSLPRQGPDSPTQAPETGGQLRPGVSDYLEGRITELDQLVAPSGLPGVNELRSGSRPLEPDDFESPAVPALLAALGREYEWVLIDAPPLSRKLELEQLLRGVDGVIFLARGHRTWGHEVFLGLKRLRSSRSPVVYPALNVIDPRYLKWAIEL